MATTAKTIRINRATGDALAEGDVKSTYSQLKEHPNGALLAVLFPHSRDRLSMTAQTPAVSRSMPATLASGRTPTSSSALDPVRSRPQIRHRQGHPGQPVQTILVQRRRRVKRLKWIAIKSPKKPRKCALQATVNRFEPRIHHSTKLTYADSERKSTTKPGSRPREPTSPPSAKTPTHTCCPQSNL